MNITKKLIGALVALFAALTLTSVGAFAAGPRPGGGEPPTTEASNNLSIPGVVVGSVGSFTLPVAVPIDGTATTLQAPTGVPSTNWPINPGAYYFVQGVNTWQAQAMYKTTETAYAAWGDNLSGDAKLKAGHPVRVEMVLTSTTVTTLEGFKVDKLEPDKLDRLATYGTLATPLEAGGYEATPTVQDARVWGPGATVTIVGPGPEGGSMTADMPGEINATGGLVFGYNWWPAVAGEYTLTFNPPAGVTIDTSTSASIDVVVGTVGGGGGKGRVR